MFAMHDIVGRVRSRRQASQKSGRIAAAAGAAVEAMEVRQMLSSYWITADTPQVNEYGPGSVTLHALPDTGEDTTWTVNFGDGTPAVTVGVPAPDDNGNPGTLSVGHTFQADENTTCHVTAQVEETGCVNGEWIDTFYDASPTDITVQDAPITVAGQQINTNEGDQFQGEVAIVTDTANNAPQGDVYRATINWEDGTVTDGTLTWLGGGQYEVDGSHEYDATGTYSPVVTAYDVGGESGAAIATVNAAKVTLTSDAPNNTVTLSKSGGSVTVKLTKKPSQVVSRCRRRYHSNAHASCTTAR